MRVWQAVTFLGVDQALEVARAAQRCGFHGIAVSDHIFYPQERTTPFPYSADGSPMWAPGTPWPDPWVLIGAMAAVTTRLRFTTYIYIAPARDLFTVAKLVSTAAVVSGGRVSLGVSAGWFREEFEQTGQDFHTRGRRLDEMIPALRALLAGGMVSYHGRHYDFGPLQIAPVPEQPVPVYVGGGSGPALRRASLLGDGWIGLAYDEEQVDLALARLDRALAEAGRDRAGFRVFLGTQPSTPDPSPELLQRYEETGVTDLVRVPWHAAAGTTTADLITGMDRFADQVLTKLC